MHHYFCFLKSYWLLVSVFLLTVAYTLQLPAKKIDRRLLQLGAEIIIEIGLGDDQHPSGYDDIHLHVLGKSNVIFCWLSKF